MKIPSGLFVPLLENSLVIFSWKRILVCPGITEVTEKWPFSICANQNFSNPCLFLCKQRWHHPVKMSAPTSSISIISKWNSWHFLIPLRLFKDFYKNKFWEKSLVQHLSQIKTHTRQNLRQPQFTWILFEIDSIPSPWVKLSMDAETSLALSPYLSLIQGMDPFNMDISLSFKELQKFWAFSKTFWKNIEALFFVQEEENFWGPRKSDGENQGQSIIDRMIPIYSISIFVNNIFPRDSKVFISNQFWKSFSISVLFLSQTTKIENLKGWPDFCPFWSSCFSASQPPTKERQNDDRC